MGQLRFLGAKLPKARDCSATLCGHPDDCVMGRYILKLFSGSSHTHTLASTATEESTPLHLAFNLTHAVSLLVSEFLPVHMQEKTKAPVSPAGLDCLLQRISSSIRSTLDRVSDPKDGENIKDF